MQAIKSSQQAIKENNLKLVFKLISENDEISRAAIKKKTRLSATTVSALVEELIENGLVAERGVANTNKTGRKAISLIVQKDGGCFASVSILRSKVKLYILDLSINIVSIHEARYKGGSPLSPLIADLIRRAVDECKIPLLGISVGVAGVIRNNRVVSSTVVDIDTDEDICGQLNSEFHVPVFLSNSSSLIAYAEKEFGTSGALNLISVDISDGVGAAIVTDGHIFTGAAGLAGEFGHLSVDFKGEPCSCGSFGCLETIASVPAILKAAKAKLGIEAAALSDINRQLAEGNGDVISLIASTAEVLAFGLNSLINIIDPEAVVIGGEIKELGDYFLAPLKAKLKSISLEGRNTKVIYSTLSEDAEAKGGAKYVFDNIF